MKTVLLCFTIFLSVLISAEAQEDRCRSRGIFTFESCPDICESFSVDSAPKCASLLQFACIYSPCLDTPGQFSCSLQPALVESVPICPGDKIDCL